MTKYVKHTIIRPELKARIVARAMQEFRLHGIRAIRMDELAAQFGISKRTLYEVFTDKEGLLKECILQARADGAAYVREVYDKAQNVLEVILGVFQYSISLVCNTNKKYFEEIKRYPEAYELMHRKNNEDSEATMNFFRQGVEQGVFRSDVNFAIVNKLVREQMNILVNSDLFSSYSFAEVYESIMFTHLRGIATERGARELEAFITEYRSKQPRQT